MAEYLIPSPDGMRIRPALPPEAVTSFKIAAPFRTHWRNATCEEAECEHYLLGWQTILDEQSQQGQMLAATIRTELKRTHIWAEDREPTGLTCFTFPPGQKCINAIVFPDFHKVRINREEIYIVQGGDWRGNPRQESRVHANAADWVDEFANHQDRLATRHAQG